MRIKNPESVTKPMLSAPFLLWGGYDWRLLKMKVSFAKELYKRDDILLRYSFTIFFDDFLLLLLRDVLK